MIFTNMGLFRQKNIALFLLCLVLLGVPSSLIYAQGEHPIDTWANACLDRNPSTAGMLKCLGQTYEQWDNELNIVYQALRRQLNEQGKAALKTSQRAWITYRDAEFTTIDTIYGALQGTMWRLVAASSKVEFVKRRTMELNSYLEDLVQ